MVSDRRTLLTALAADDPLSPALISDPGCLAQPTDPPEGEGCWLELISPSAASPYHQTQGPHVPFSGEESPTGGTGQDVLGPNPLGRGAKPHDPSHSQSVVPARGPLNPCAPKGGRAEELEAPYKIGGHPLPRWVGRVDQGRLLIMPLGESSFGGTSREVSATKAGWVSSWVFLSLLGHPRHLLSTGGVLFVPSPQEALHERRSPVPRPCAGPWRSILGSRLFQSGGLLTLKAVVPAMLSAENLMVIYFPNPGYGFHEENRVNLSTLDCEGLSAASGGSSKYSPSMEGPTMISPWWGDSCHGMDFQKRCAKRTVCRWVQTPLRGGRLTTHSLEHCSVAAHAAGQAESGLPNSLPHGGGKGANLRLPGQPGYNRDDKQHALCGECGATAEGRRKTPQTHTQN